jgi:asparagine synthetase B (glutamine-hydrolysing)
MCGIYFSLSTSSFVPPDEKTLSLLRNRGPDSVCEHKLQLPGKRACEGSSAHHTSQFHLTFISTVLALRGDRIQSQPLIDAGSQSALCWNGEAWRISDEPVSGNDTQCIFQLLLEALEPSLTPAGDGALSIESGRSSLQRLAAVISTISGPFSFVLYDGFHSRIIYGKDSLGRRSLLRGWDEAGNFKISSVCDGTSSKYFDEIDTDGLHVIELADSVTNTTQDDLKIETLPWVVSDDYIAGSCTLVSILFHISPPLANVYGRETLYLS